MSLEQLHDATEHLYEIIKTKYFQPFIVSLKKSGLHEIEIIQEAFRHLQLSFASSACNMPGEFKRLKFLQDFDNAPMQETFKQQLLNKLDLKNDFIQLGFIYLDKNRQKEEFSEFSNDNAEIQTCIRKLFYDYINPLPKMQVRTLDIPISTGNEQKNNGILFNIPLDPLRKIYSCLDSEGILLFKGTCKSAYFLHKSFQKQNTTLYLIADKVKITISRGLLFTSVDVSKKEIISSLYNKNEARVYCDLYGALEYVNYLQHKESNYDRNNVFIRSLWPVHYIGNPAHLKFTQENIVLYEGSSAGAFSGNQRDVIVSYAVITKNLIQPPQLGIVICPDSNFAGYQILNSVEFGEYALTKSVARTITDFLNNTKEKLNNTTKEMIGFFNNANNFFSNFSKAKTDSEREECKTTQSLKQ